MNEYNVKEYIYTIPSIKVLDYQMKSEKENHIVVEIKCTKDYLKWDYFCEKVLLECNGRVKIVKNYPRITFIFPTDDNVDQYLVDLGVGPVSSLEAALCDFSMVLDRKYYLIEKPILNSINVFFKTTNRCNINCRYCYETPYRRMVEHNEELSFSDIEKFTEMLTRYAENITVIFHGGEPTLPGVKYYRHIMGEIFTKYPYANFMDCTMQSNCINLNEEWYSWARLCGVSMGCSYNAAHPEMRYGENAKEITNTILEKILDARESGVNMGNLEVLTSKDVPNLIELYEFYKKINLPNSFLPIFNEGSARGKEFSPTKDLDEYLKHITKYFTHWLTDPNPVDDRLASAYSQILYTGIGMSCDQNGCVQCVDTQLGLMSNGELFPCDRPLYERYDLGNIREFDNIEDIYNSEKYRRYRNEVNKKLETCKKCEFFDYCHGGCPMEDIEENGRANIINEKQCNDLKVNILGMYRALSKLTLEECNPKLRWMLIVNNAYLPNEIPALLEYLGIRDQFGELNYNEEATLEGTEWKLFKLFNGVNMNTKMFPEIHCYDQYDDWGDVPEDNRFEVTRNLLLNEKNAIMDKLVK